MQQYEDYVFTENELKRIQKIIAQKKIDKYIKKHGHEPTGNLSPFFEITDEDIKPYRIRRFCEWFFGQNANVLNDYCFVDKSATNAVIDSNNVAIEKGTSYYASIVPLNGYEVLRENVLIKMGDEDITNTAFKGNAVNISAVTNSISISIVATIKTHCSVSVEIENAEFSGETYVKRGTPYTAFITPYEGYAIKRAQVVMGGVDVTNTVYNNGEIHIQSVNGDISIVCTIEIRTFTIHQSYSHSAQTRDEVVAYGDYYCGNIEIPEHYDVTDIMVKMGAIDITDIALSGLSVFIESVTENVVITVNTELHKYDVIYQYAGESSWTEYETVEWGKTLSKTIPIEPGVGLYLCKCVVGEREKFFPDGKLSMTIIDDTVYVYIEKRTIPNNEILYINIDGEIESHIASSAISSNTIENEVGILRFTEPITTTAGLFSSTSLRLSNVYLPNSVGNNIHFANSKIKSVNLPETTTELPASAFIGCEYLTSLKGVEHVTKIGSCAFSGTTSSLTWNFPSFPNLIEIASSAFTGTVRVRIKGAKKLETIGNGAFRNVSGVTISELENLKTIGLSAFERTSWTSSDYDGISLSGNITNVNVGNLAFKFRYIISFPFNAISSAGISSFMDIRKTNGLDLSSAGITNLGNVFSTNATINGTIKLGASVTAIGNFLNSSGISSTTIYCYSETCPSVGSVHSNIKAKKGTLHIPQGADYSDLLAALGPNWTKVEDIVLDE